VKIDEIGATRVWVKNDGSAFLFHPDCYAGVLAAWDGNERRFSGRDIYGDLLTVKVADIVCVSLATPEVLALAKQDEAEQKQREALS